MSSSLESIFNEEPAAVESPVTPEPVVEEAPQPEPEAPKGETGEPPAPKVESEPERMVPLKALEEERRKRQEAEARATQQAQKPTPDIFDDPEGYQKHMQEQLSQATMNERFNLSREMMLMFKDDYEQREAEFLQLVEQDETLRTKIAQAPNPAKFAYETAVKAEKAKMLENVDEYAAKIRAEVEAKVRAELEGKYKAEADSKQKLRDSIPPSLAAESSSGAVKGSNWSGPTPLSDIFRS